MANREKLDTPVPIVKWPPNSIIKPNDATSSLMILCFCSNDIYAKVAPNKECTVVNDKNEVVLVILKSSVDYSDVDKELEKACRDHLEQCQKVATCSFARVGILGNPSDGYHGKTLSSTVEEYFATVEMEQNDTVVFVPSLEGDANTFLDLESMVQSVKRYGYDGGLKLLMATTKTFWDVISVDEKILIPNKQKGFRMSYSTTIPRQSGLAGSSAICTSAFRALMRWYGIPSSFIAPARLANYVLRVEQKELGITAGLQDRVAQAFDRLVFMDFTSYSGSSNDIGKYEPLPREYTDFFQGKLYLLFSKTSLAEDVDGKSSGKVHSPVRKQWESGDPFTRDTMAMIAELAEKAKEAIKNRDDRGFVNLMNQNFDLRCKLFGNAVSLHDRNMVAAVRALGEGIGAKLPGSGGAVLVFAADGDKFIEDSQGLTDSIKVVPLTLRHDDINLHK